jgi:hypothetical protein
MTDYEPLDYRLRCHSKRTDLPPDVLRDICEAYEAIERLTKERDEARKEVLLWVKERCSWAELSDEIKKRGWEYLKEDGK